MYQKYFKNEEQNQIESQIAKLHKQIDQLTRNQKVIQGYQGTFYFRESKKAKFEGSDKLLTTKEKDKINSRFQQLPVPYQRGIWEILFEEPIDKSRLDVFNVNTVVITNRQYKEIEKYCQ